MTYKEGFLTKQGGFIKTWKRRWFVLTNTDLVYYTQPNGEEKGRISIVNNECTFSPECKAQPSFKIVTKQRTFYIVGESVEDVSLWVQAIHKAQGKGDDSKGDDGKGQNAKPKFSLDDFEQLKTLGKGTYGKVTLVRYKGDGKVYAMKSMSKKTLAEFEQVNQIVTERDILIRNAHPFLVSAHFTFQTSEQLIMVLDYVPGGELFKRLSDEGPFSEERVRLYAAEILLGLSHLHNLGFIYRDLKPENILVDAQGHLKITDFGLAKKTANTTETFCGTPEYIAPEMLTGCPYTKAVDWWSYGTLLFEMLSGLPPFFDDNVPNMYKMILNDEVVFPEEIGPDAQDLISKLLIKNPEERLGSVNDADDIRAHPFFKSINWDDVLNKKTKPEWVPEINSETDVQNFDEEFTQDKAQDLPDGVVSSDQQMKFEGFTCTQESVFGQEF